MGGQALRKQVDGEIPTKAETTGGVTRKAPSSKGLLEEVDTQLAKPKLSHEQRVKRILEECRCL